MVYFSSSRAETRFRALTLLLALCALLPGCVRGEPSFPPASAVTFKGEAVTATDWRTEMLAGWTTPAPTGNAEATADGVKLVTTQQPEHLYTLQAQILNQVPLHKGDTLLLRFAGRSLLPDKNTGVTKLTVVFGQASADWHACLKREIGLSAAWQRFDMPFTCDTEWAAKEARVVISFGYPAQVAEIADVQLLRYGPDVALSALPKTKRYADPIPPDVMQKEMARIAAMKRELDAVADPAPAHGKTLYVTMAGSAAGDGTPGKPFATIPQALAVVQPGDTILVGAGEYHEPRGIGIKKSGRPDAWIKIHAAPGARPKIITSNWSGFEMRGGIAYIEIAGFELQWVTDPAVTGDNGTPVHGVGLAPMYASHHLRFLNNVIHGYGTSGIGSLDCDYLYLEGNVIYDCAKTSPYGGSGISLCRAFNYDDAPGYHNVLRRNVCYDNELRVSTQVSSGGNGKVLTDGNGIIIDSFRQSRANPLKPHYEDKTGPLLPYRGRTLLENNLVYDNGGRGIHVFRSDKVDILNNTCYENQKTPDINAGELTAIESDDIVLANNLSYGRTGKRANTQDGSTRVFWANNLFFNADDVLMNDSTIVGRDPLFVAAALTAKPDGFRLRPGSPALGKGIAAIAPNDDLSGAPRPANGPVDIGAYQRSKG